MACAPCCDVTDVMFSDEATEKYGIDASGDDGCHCRVCLTDFCEYHSKKLEVHSEKWNGGCCYCKGDSNSEDSNGDQFYWEVTPSLERETIDELKLVKGINRSS